MTIPSPITKNNTMTKIREIYVCELCGNTIEVLTPGDGDLACCGQEMVLQKENTVEAAQEKHVPVLKVEGTVATVNVGSVPHPMEPNHNIAWIEIVQNFKLQRVTLQSGDAPQAVFSVEPGAPISVRASCNLHGVWSV